MDIKCLLIRIYRAPDWGQENEFDGNDVVFHECVFEMGLNINRCEKRVLHLHDNLPHIGLKYHHFLDWSEMFCQKCQ
ncbi:MAG: hypothetical protein C7B44_10175 [Sulfobacillus thermosulfidooxidans]|nr:MAG: hypothetical protein C7B44_10175 [Sulfobacillus thermosulfidooxidans]